MQAHILNLLIKMIVIRLMMIEMRLMVMIVMRLMVSLLTLVNPVKNALIRDFSNNNRLEGRL